MRQRRIAQPAPEPEPEAPPEAAETPEPQQSSGHKAEILEARRAYMRQYYWDHREASLERRRLERRRLKRLEPQRPKPQGSAAPPKNAPQFPVRGQSARWQVTTPKKAPPAKAPPCSAALAPFRRLSAKATAPSGHVSRHHRGKAPAGMGLSMSKDASA